MVLSGTAANASLISQRSMSRAVMPALREALLGRGAGRGEHDDRLRACDAAHRDDAPRPRSPFAHA